MAWTAPRTNVSGELYTAAILNTHLRDNSNALYGGVMSIASQAAYDIIYATSASQLGRLPLTALQSVRKNAANNALEAYTPAASPVTSYAVTKADAANTTSATDILTFTVLANTWADGDVVEVFGWFLTKNNKGTSGTFGPLLYVGGVSFALSDAAQADSATECKVAFRLILQRAGSSVLIINKDKINNLAVRSLGSGDLFTDVWVDLAPPFEQTWTPTFTNDIIIKWSVTPSAAHATFYCKPQSCRAWKIGA